MKIRSKSVIRLARYVKHIRFLHSRVSASELNELSDPNLRINAVRKHLHAEVMDNRVADSKPYMSK